MTKPRFVVDHLSPMNNRRKLQVFLDLACYVARYMDPGDPVNRAKAEAWLTDQIDFLSPGDMAQLLECWQFAIEDGANTRALFTLVKQLQDDYDL